MIIVQLSGGLGNQMFQYALGRALALRYHTELYLDISHYTLSSIVGTRREYALKSFGVPVKILSKKQSYLLQTRNRLYIKPNKYIPFALKTLPIRYYQETSFEYQRGILDVVNNTYLSGYWQSEQYFALYRKQIIRDFSGRTNKISRNNLNLRRAIVNSDSVSIHIRRADYLTDPNNRMIYRICGLSYYKKAMKYIEQIIDKPKYFIFSDDLDWAKKYFHSVNELVFVHGNEKSQSHEDLRLMSYCKHNIIANSSFSWWAAWLNKNKNKTVISPKYWFKGKSINTQDLIPKGWVKI